MTKERDTHAETRKKLHQACKSSQWSSTYGIIPTLKPCTTTLEGTRYFREKLRNERLETTSDHCNHHLSTQKLDLSSIHLRLKDYNTCDSYPVPWAVTVAAKFAVHIDLAQLGQYCHRFAQVAWARQRNFFRWCPDYPVPG